MSEAPEIEQESEEQDPRAAALALMADRFGEQSDDEAEAEAPPEPVAEPEPAKPDSETQRRMDMLAKQSKAAREELEAAKREREEFRKEREQFAKDQREFERRYRKAIEIEADPTSVIKYIDDPKSFTTKLHKRALESDRYEEEEKRSAFQARMDALEAENKRIREELEGKFTERDAAEQARAQQQAKHAFVAHVAQSSDKYPLFSRLDPSEQAEEASKLAAQLMEAGENDFDWDTLASKLESNKRQYVEKLTGRTLEPAPSAGTSQTRQAPRAQTGPRTLTNEQGSTTASKSPDLMTEAELRKAAMKRLDQFYANRAE